ncbi:FK506-binding nuclear protein, partial [Lecanoromycetidae sp. Uapishka_2]
MSSMLPVAVYGLKVPAGDVMIPAVVDFPATFRITMAAIDPTAKPEHTGTANGDTPVRATLKMVYDPSGPGEGDDDSEGSDDEENYLNALLEGRESDDEEDEETSSDDEETNGGPSDPSKTKKARKEAAMKELIDALAEQNESDDVMDVDTSAGANGTKTKSKPDKGKARALIGDSEDEDSEEDSDDSLDGMEELVVCTLDPEKNYQQTLDITIPEDQRAYFKVSGTHAIYLSGNYVIPQDSGHGHEHGIYDDEDEEDEYDMSPDEDEIELDEESDELDALEDPRVTEVASDDEAEPPKLVKKEEPLQKGKNKRAHEESSDVEVPTPSLDDIMAKSLKPAVPTTNGATNGEPKLSKKQLKKLKNNAGKAVEAAAEGKDVKVDEGTSGAKDSSASKADKKVQFAKNLEQGPATSPSTAKSDTDKKESKKDEGKPKASLGVKTVQGVKIDDKKLGSGPAAKKGNKVGMRYIGKLKDGKVFDANKKGKPFSFTIGDGSVIKGWDIGVAGMLVGGERRVIIPPELAYGKKNMSGIPPNSELTFDLKLLEIN